MKRNDGKATLKMHSENITTALFSVAVTKPSDQKQPIEEKSLFHLTLPKHNPKYREIRQRPKAGSGSSSHRRTSLIRPAYWISSASFLIQPRPTCQGILTLGLALCHQSPIKTISYRHTQRLVWSRQFLSWVSLFPGDCVKAVSS